MSASPQSRRFGVGWILMVVATIGFVFYWAILPNFVSRGPTKHTMIWNRLRQLDAAKERWAVEKGVAKGVEPSIADLTPYLPEGFWDRPAAGERCVINDYGSPVQAVLTRQIEDYPAGAVLELTLDGVLVEKASYQSVHLTGASRSADQTNQNVIGRWLPSLTSLGRSTPRMDR